MPAQHVVLLLGSLTPRRSIQLKPDRQKVVFFIVLIARNGVAATQSLSLTLSSVSPGKSLQQEAVLGVIVLFVGLCWLPRGYVLDHITLLAKLAKSETSGAEAFKIN